MSGARTKIAALCAAIVAFACVVLDVVVRGPGAYLREPRLFGAVCASIGLGFAIVLVRNRSVRTSLGALLGLVIATQATFAWFWHVPIDRQIFASALHNLADVRAVLLAMKASVLAIAIVGIASGAGLARFATLSTKIVKYTGPLAASAFAAVAFGLVVAPSPRRATPEVALLDAVVAHVQSRQEAAASTGARAARDEAPIAVAKPRLPNVVFVLTESVRADDACVAPNAPCLTMPELHRLFPDRIPLTEMRAISSYTAVSISALLTGRTQTGPRDVIANAPTMFELVRRVHAGTDRPRVDYLSAQMASVFEREDIPKQVDTFVSVETLVGAAINDEDEVVHRGVDRLLASRARATLSELEQQQQQRAPFFLFLHLAGTHAPYFVDEKVAPFAPWSRTVSWSKLPELRNAYRNAIVAQDAALAPVLERILQVNGDAPLIVVYTSDHGEAFGEHGAIHHGQNLYEEQLHVPAWIALRNGALDSIPGALDHLREHANAVVTHLDLLPTILDAYGALDAFALRAVAESLPGRSLFRARRALEPLPITNCTAMFPCPLNAWGMLDDHATLTAQPWDPDWRCIAHGAGPASDCAIARAASHQHFPRLPNGNDNGTK